MLKTDMLVRDRLDFKKHVDAINQANRRNLEESRDSLVFRARNDSAVKGTSAGKYASGFIDRRE